MFINIYNKKITRFRKFWFRRRWNKSRKRHAESFFNSRLKKFLYYYKRNKKIKFYENNSFKSQLPDTFNIGLKSFEKNYLIKTPLIAVIKLTKRFTNKNKFKKAFKAKMCIFPDFALTAKPKSIRMGKGKGEVTKFVYFLKIGNIIHTMRYRRKKLKKAKKKKLWNFILHLITEKLNKKISYKLPIRTFFIKRIW